MCFLPRGFLRKIRKDLLASRWGGWCLKLAGAKPVEELAKAALCPAGAVRVHEDQEPDDEDGQSDLCHVVSLTEWSHRHKPPRRSTACLRYLSWGLGRAPPPFKRPAR